MAAGAYRRRKELGHQVGFLLFDLMIRAYAAASSAYSSCFGFRRRLFRLFTYNSQFSAPALGVDTLGSAYSGH